MVAEYRNRFNIYIYIYMADIFRTIFSSAFYWIKMYLVTIRFSLILVASGPINSTSALVKIMAWRLPGDSHYLNQQATALDAWASRVKCPARFVSHLHDICIYIWVVYSFCLFCCLFIIVTTQFVALYKPCKPKPKPSTYDPPDNHPLAEIQRPILRPEPKQQICHQHANTDHFGK